jgi:fucose permease
VSRLPDRARRRPRRARWAVSTVFLINGVVVASWVPLIPEVKARHGIGDGQLGLLLLFMAIGAVLALPLAGWLIGRLGSRVMTSLAVLGLSSALPLPLISPNVPLVAVSLVLLGAFNGTLDVAMNAQAIAVEGQYARPIMSSFHGLFSLGGVVGAGIASATMALGVGHEWHIAGVTLGSAALIIGALGHLSSSPPPRTPTAPVFSVPSAALLGLGLLTFCGLLAEGAMGDWSAVYLHDTLGTTSATAATGFAVFSLSMAVGRFAGDRFVKRLGPVAALRTSTAIAAAGLAVALVIGTSPAAILGFGVVGLGIANVIPVLFSSAGQASGRATGSALAAVATTGYCGYLAGPPLIGLAAELTGLRAALGLVSGACALIAVSAGWVVTVRAHPIRTIPARGEGRLRVSP